ncbi:hypothetical protein SSX86_021380 [Deinandra increscens subsp. villosa]|uniref:USP domain-containing protein n=1 Tax=Deinandra increscens subsp. villosa TaxID=3103831 RepID=A0AAP0GU96_9ASTR
MSSSISSSSNPDTSSDESSDRAAEMFFQIMVHRHQRRLNARANRVLTRSARLNRNREEGQQMLLRDYFNDDCVYPPHMFHQRFRMNRSLFLRIVNDLEREHPWFPQRSDARGRIGFTPLQKCTAALRMMAYGTTGDGFDEYLRMSDRTLRSCLQKFSKGIYRLYQRKYLRRPTASDIRQLYEFHENKWGFRGMLGSIDCTHWEWKNCPNAWRAQFMRGDHSHPTIMLEAVASYDMWIWHQFFGVAGANNDINVMDRSPIWDDIVEGREPDSSFELRGVTYKRGYYLADGIYPDYSTIVKGFTAPIGERRKIFTDAQTAARKDVERTFARLKGDEQSTEPLAPEDKSPFRRIEFHLARKPYTGFSNGGGGDGSFRIETLNPAATSSKIANAKTLQISGGGVSGKKRDASELENGLDPELSFGITFRRIGAGLENLGNTCFLNSVLQCLTYTEPLAAYLQSGKHQVTCRKSGFCALCAIQKHVSRALQSSGRSLAPKDLVSNLRCISRTFRNSRQEDAHEYMVNLLESMHKCCLPNGVPSESQSAYDKSLVHKIFGGRLRSQVKCMQCNYCSDKFDPFLDLSLEILRADTLYKAFANFTAKEQLDGGAKQYQCQQCKQKVKALKQLTIHKPPNVLTVHLKRFGSHMSGQKIDKKIQFGSTLDLKPFVTGQYDGDLKYTLYGVLVHAGWSTHSGHYYCFVRTSSGMWYSLDDNRVYQVSEKKVFEQKAYMLFYFKDRKNFPTKKTTPNGPGVRRQTQMNTVLSNGSLNGQTSLIKAADVHLNEKIVMNGTPNGASAPKEVQMKMGLSNGSLNIAPKKIQTNTIVTNVSSNGHNSVTVSTQVNDPGAPKEAQMKTGLSSGSLSAEMSLADVGTNRNGPSPVAPENTLTKPNLSNTSLNGQKCSATLGAMRNGFSTGAAEVTQKEAASSPKSILKPGKTEDQAKEIGGGVSSGGNRGGDGHVELATTLLKSSGLPKTESSMEIKVLNGETHQKELPDTSKSEKKAIGGKTHKKLKNSLKCKIVSMKFSSNVLMGTALSNQRKKKKHKRNRRVKNLGQENLVDEGPSSSVKTEAQKMVEPPVEIRLKERVDKIGAVLATSDFSGDSTRSQSKPKGANHLEHHSRSLAQKDMVHMLTIGVNDRAVPRWDEDESAPSQVFRQKTGDLTIGHIGDEWDEEYDRGKRKKVRISKTEFDGRNPFQDIANERLESHLGKQNSSKRPPMINKKNTHSKKSRSGHEPYRI